MKLNTSSVIDNHEKFLEKINKQRHYWLWSSFVFCFSIFLIFGWDWIDDLRSKHIWWFIISLMLIVSINWWYWTMRIIRKVITYQAVEYKLLKSISDDLTFFKKELSELKEIQFSKLDK